MTSLPIIQSTPSTNERHVSVAICTYNRPQMLRVVLETLEGQEVDREIDWEVLVVDNDPHLSARPIFEAHSLISRLRLRYIHEQRPGLSHARNRAIIESQGSIIAFLDDDVMVPRRWLLEMLQTFERSGADCVGGRVLVKWEGRPEDAVKACETELVAFDKGDGDFRLLGRDVPIGANLALKTSSLRDQTAFLSDLGRTQTNLMGCEEVELLLRLMRQGRSIWYSAGAVVMHRTGGERLTAAYYKKREYWNGISLAAVDTAQNRWMYCHFKAWARLTQVIVAVWPAFYWALITRNTRSRFLNACYKVKYLGYWQGVLGFARRPR